MAYEFGTTYSGLTADDYAAIIELGNDALNQWLADNMEAVAGGAYYIYTGSDQMGLMEQMLDIGMEDSISYFIYLKSTWQITGM